MGVGGKAQPREGAPGDHVLVTLDLELPSRAFLDAHGREPAAGRSWGQSTGNCGRSCSLKVTEVWDATCYREPMSVRGRRREQTGEKSNGDVGPSCTPPLFPARVYFVAEAGLGVFR